MTVPLVRSHGKIGMAGRRAIRQVKQAENIAELNGKHFETFLNQVAEINKHRGVLNAAGVGTQVTRANVPGGFKVSGKSYTELVLARDAVRHELEVRAFNAATNEWHEPVPGYTTLHSIDPLSVSPQVLEVSLASLLEGLAARLAASHPAAPKKKNKSGIERGSAE
ncbi:MAG: hypothetical protein K1X64_19320 [Myxococcaceae bacterium]|nr:hypothetical protein [Myxococcaceae bacterium]